MLLERWLNKRVVRAVERKANEWNHLYYSLFMKYPIYTFEAGVPEDSPRFARFPRSICTEILACDRSTPALCSAWLREFNNLFIIWAV